MKPVNVSMDSLIILLSCSCCSLYCLIFTDMTTKMSSAIRIVTQNSSENCFPNTNGRISPEAEKLIRVTEECFWVGVRECVVGNRLGDVGAAIDRHARRNGFTAIREFTGHGIGREMHEDPPVYNFGDPGRGMRIRRGMTLAVEPMIAMGDWHLSVDDDGWCARTIDHSWCAHYEHTIAVTDGGLPEILTLPGFTWEAEL